MVQQGNHEQDWYNTTTIGDNSPELGRDSGGECGVPTSSRFIMPTAASSLSQSHSESIEKKVFHDDPFWYSFDAGTVRVFRQKFTLEDAIIGSHACTLEAIRRATNAIPLGCPLFLPVHTVNCVQTLKDPYTL
jgi:hypothetical protein